MPTLTETQTRKQLIDPALQKAGWDVANSDLVVLEVPIHGNMMAGQITTALIPRFVLGSGHF